MSKKQKELIAQSPSLNNNRISEIHSALASQIRKFPENSLSDAINLVIYGKPVLKKYTKKRRMLHSALVFLHEDDFSYLQWISKRKLYADSRIDLKSVTNISDEPTQNSLKKLKRDNLLVLTVGEKLNDYLALEFPNPQIKQLWWQGIQYFWLLSRNPDNKHEIKNLSKYLFLKFDKDGTKYLDKKEVKALLNEMHINVLEEWFEKIFAKFDSNKNQQLDYEEFRALMNELSFKQEVLKIFTEFCARANEGIDNPELNVMTAEELQIFYLKAQNQKMDLKKDIYPLIDYYKENKEDQSHDMSFLHFCGLLFSMENQIFNKEKTQIFMDMNQPLPSYWINSSHNTYLVSNQLTGESSTQAYVNAFQKGCRCVELDCWDGEKGEPIVYHGHTLTSKLLFADVIQTIKDYAFVKNPFPVILSIENHCTKKQQDRMAQIMKSIFGDMLYYLPKNWDNMNFPSPNELKKKILIKDKAKIKTQTENFNDDLNENVRLDDISERKMADIHNLTSIMQPNYLKKASVEVITFESDTKLQDNKMENKLKQNYGYQMKNIEEIENKILMQDLKDKPERGNKKRLSKALEPIPEKSPTEPLEKPGKKKKDKPEEKSEELISIITIFGCKMVLGDINRLSWNISSLSEEKVLKQLQSNEVDFINHNKWTFTRTYPGGMRIDSSNYDPMPAFVTGCQVIALNFQTNDLNLQIYLSKFMINGGVNCGYVLKPEFMLKSCKKPKYPKDFTTPAFKIILTIISGNQFKPLKKNDRDIIDPFVEVNLKGLPIEEKSNKAFKTKVVQNNGFNPQFGEVFTFDVYCPELAILVFQVWDQDNMSNEKVGSYAIPVDCLRTGYRIVPLKNEIDFKFIEFSYVFCHIEKRAI